MHILMFGWEFPPLISGGLGTACYAMTRSLAESGEKITFILPKSDGIIQQEGYEVLSADDLQRMADREC